MKSEAKREKAPTDLLTPVEVANRISMSRSHLTRLRIAGTGPRYFKLGGYTVRYSAADVDSWLDDQRVVEAGKAKVSA